MIKRTLHLYRDSFTGLSYDIWLLGLVTLINRSGTMVIPFLTVYLTTQLRFSLPEAGYVMSCFGLGSVLGSWLGGQLSDKIGYYKVMFWSLLLSGFAFISLQWVHTLPAVCIAIFVLSVIVESFRPALFASVAAYAKPENTTRSFSLLRLAINLGFSVGPAVGGILAASYGYYTLFWVDGLTCIAASFLFLFILNEKAEAEPASTKTEETDIPIERSAYRDNYYLLFIGLTSITAIVFMQLFSTLPVFYREELQFSEATIGLLMACNGLIIALTEMPLVFKLDGRYNNLGLISIGTALIGLSFLIFTFLPGLLIIAVLSMVLITVGEMLNFPFTNSFAVARATKKTRGQYMALYSMAFSVAHIVSPALGLQIAGNFGYNALWYVLGILSLISMGGTLMMRKRTVRTAVSA